MDDLNSLETSNISRNEDAFQGIAETLVQIQKAIGSQANKLRELDMRLKQFDESVQRALAFRTTSSASNITHFSPSDTKYNSAANGVRHPGSVSSESFANETSPADSNSNAVPLTQTSSTPAYVPLCSSESNSSSSENDISGLFAPSIDSSSPTVSNSSGSPNHLSTTSSFSFSAEPLLFISNLNEIPSFHNSSPSLNTNSIPQVSTSTSIPSTKYLHESDQNIDSPPHSLCRSSRDNEIPLETYSSSPSNHISSITSTLPRQSIPSSFIASMYNHDLDSDPPHISSSVPSVSVPINSNFRPIELSPDSTSSMESIDDFPPPPDAEELKSLLGEDLMTAAFLGKSEDLLKLLEAGADVNIRDSCEKTPLHIAAGNANSDAISLLIEKGADINAVDTFGNSALFTAAYNDPSGRCVSLLIGAGVDVHSANTNGFTPLHLAALSDNVAGVRALVSAGCSKTCKDNAGRIPFDCAQEEDIRQLLRPTSTFSRTGCSLVQGDSGVF